MAMNFPNSPTVGAIYQAPGGPTYKWDGSMWIPQQGILPAYQLHGGIRLGRVDNTTMSITPVNGGMLIIDNVSRPVVAMNKSLSGITPDVIRYVYAFWTGTAIDYEFSATAHVATANGIEVKSGDPSRTLVGMVFYSSVFFFRDEDLYRFVTNWFEGSKIEKTCSLLTGLVTASSTSQVGLGVCYAVTWAGTGIEATIGGFVYASSGPGLGITGIFINSLNTGVECHSQMAVVNNYYPASTNGKSTVASDMISSFQPTGRTAGVNFQTNVQLVTKLRM